MEFDSNVSGVIEDHGNVDTSADTLVFLQPEEVSEGKHIDINKEGFLKKEICPRGSDACKGLHMKGIPRDI